MFGILGINRNSSGENSKLIEISFYHKNSVALLRRLQIFIFKLNMSWLGNKRIGSKILGKMLFGLFVR